MTGALAPFIYLVDNVLPLEYNFIIKKLASTLFYNLKFNESEKFLPILSILMKQISFVKIFSKFD